MFKLRRTQFAFLWLALGLLIIVAVSTIGRTVSPGVALPMYLSVIAAAALLLRFFMAPRKVRSNENKDKNKQMKT